MEQILDHLYLFKGLEQDSLLKIAAIANQKSYSPGETIFSYGDPADALYMIDHGIVKIDFVEEDGSIVGISKLGTGSHFGEMPMLDNEPRSANAISESHSDIISIPYQQLEQLLHNEPTIAVHFYRELSRFLCGRLRLTTLDLTYSRTHNLPLF